jgi:hypothetical protein
MRKASTRMPEQGTQTPSPAPDLIPAKTEHQPRTYTEIGTVNGGTSDQYCLQSAQSTHPTQDCVALRLPLIPQVLRCESREN